MKKAENLIKNYKGFEFSSGGQTGADYKSFESKMRGVIKSAAEAVGANLASFSRGHYDCSAFVERDGKFAYVSISDVRFFSNDWIDNILIRTAKGTKDYTGGSNSWTTLLNLSDNIDRILK